MSRCQLTVIDECASTNAALPSSAPHGSALLARRQTAGRGQRGNTWESAPGLNVTMSLMVRPGALPAARQWELSEAACLGVADAVEALGVSSVAVKWPNDVYAGNRKLAGILIENAIGAGGLISRSVVGVGLNVNQTEFLSDAPNPVSLAQLLGHELDVEATARAAADAILRRLELGAERNRADYRRRLWRGTGVWDWVDAQGCEFRAEVVDVLPTGHLHLSGHAPFAFKEVRPAGFRW